MVLQERESLNSLIQVLEDWEECLRAEKKQ